MRERKKNPRRGQIIWCERDQGVLHIDEGNVPQTVGSLGRNVFGTDLVGIQAQHSQLGEVSHVDGAAETAQSEV